MRLVFGPTQTGLSWASSSPEELRVHHARDAAARAGDLPENVEEAALPETGAFRGGLLFKPAHCSMHDIIVYFHGGGFVAGSPETHRCTTAWLAERSGMRVLSARYRLAPDYPFPAQREDALAACGTALGLSGGAADTVRLFLSGDSAGACVALWGLGGLDAGRRARVAGLVLFYGAFGLVEGSSVSRYGTPENGLDSETLRAMYRRLGVIPHAGGTSVWPVDFAGEITEPTYVLAAERDALFDDSIKLFQSLGRSNPANTLAIVEGREHGFLKGAGRDPVACRALEEAARWVAGLNSVRNQGTEPLS